MGQKGNNFVEYALMLGLVVGIGWGVFGSYGDGIPGIFGSAAELLQAGSKSDKVYDRHMKWLKDSLLALAQKEPGNGVQSVFDYMGGTNGSYFDQRKGPEFTTMGRSTVTVGRHMWDRSIPVRSKVTAGRWSVIRKKASCTMRSPFTARIIMTGRHWPIKRRGRRSRRMCIG